MLFLYYFKDIINGFSTVFPVFHQTFRSKLFFQMIRRYFMQNYNNVSLIFPVIQPFPQVLGGPRLRADVLAQIIGDSALYAAYQSLSLEEREAFLEFCMGNRGLKVTYDPFFQHLFDPVLHPGRLERLISCILGQEVHVVQILPRESRRLSEGSSLVVMDILVRLSDGRLVDVEMQRVGYDFPIERGFCYGADLMIRQYDMAREEQGSGFSYRSIKPVYVIVLMERSPAVFHGYPDQYIHRSAFSFDSGLSLEPLQNFIYIPLDIFRRMPHNEFKLTELEAWLCFLGSDDPADILRIVEKYPFFGSLYEDIVKFRFQPKELIAMYSDALRIMDENTIKYMVDEMRDEIDRMNEVLTVRDSEIALQQDELSRRDVELSQKDAELSRKQAEIDELRARLAQYQT